MTYYPEKLATIFRLGSSSQDAKVTSTVIQSKTSIRYSQAKSTNSRYNEKQESPLSGRQLKHEVMSRTLRMERGGLQERMLETLLAGMPSRCSRERRSDVIVREGTM